MTLLTRVCLLDQYGPLMSTVDLAKVLKITPQYVRSRLSKGTLPLKRNSEGLFFTDDVAAYIDKLKPSTEEEAAGAAG